MDIFGKTAQWFVETNQMPQNAAPNARQAAFYIGMQVEELAEKLEAIFPKGFGYVFKLQELAKQFKNGLYDSDVVLALNERPKDLLDADVDSLWVTIGAARAQGADVEGAYFHLIDRNYAKRWEDGTFHRDPATGKVLKPEGWTPPDHTPFIHPSLKRDK